MKRKIYLALITLFIHLLGFEILNLYDLDEQDNYRFDEQGVVCNIQPDSSKPLFQPEITTEIEPIPSEKVTIKEITTKEETVKPELEKKIEEQIPSLDTIPPQLTNNQVIDTLPKQSLFPDSLKADIEKQIAAQNESKQQLDSARLAKEQAYHEKLVFMWNNAKAIRNLRKVYPYALKAKILMDEVNRRIDTIKTEKEKRLYLKKTEQELMATFRKDIEKMTYSQGKILLKLIDRETNKNAYSIVKEYRGTTNAIFWQGIARVFGANLKTKYEPNGADSLLEKITVMYENGDLDDNR